MSVVSSGASRRPPGTGSPAGSPGAPGVAVESATWRPVRTVDLDGWLLGVSGGFTRRANSVLPLAEPADLDAALAAVEHEYHGAGRAAVFRVCAAARPADLAARLRGRGYRTVAATQVLVRGVDEHARAPEPTAGMHLSVADVPDDAWLDGWLSVKATGGDAHRDLARSVVHGSPALYVRAVAGDRTLGVVRAARAGDWVGLSCLVVDPRARRRGLATTLTLTALAAAARDGARRAFLQVEEANAPARALYDGLGFTLADAYCYAELPVPGADERPAGRIADPEQVVLPGASGRERMAP